MNKTPEKVYKIFISYCDDDVSFFLHEKLRQNQFVTWIDRNELHKTCSGERYWECILKAIEEAAFFIVLISENSVVNENVLKEISKAKKVQEQRNQKNFIQYYILDSKTLSQGVTLNNCEHVLFTGNDGHQVFLHFENSTAALSKLLAFLSIQLKKPIQTREKKNYLITNYIFWIGKERREIKFITVFIVDLFLDGKEKWKIILNPFGYKREYNFKVSHTLYTINFTVSYRLLWGTIKSITNEILFDEKVFDESPI